MSVDFVRFQIESEDFGSHDALQIFEFIGHEAVGKPFEYLVSVITTQPDLVEAEKFQGARVTIVMSRENDELRRIQGMICKVDDLLDVEAATHSYRLHVVPHVHNLTLVRTQEILMGLTYPEIIERKLRDVGFESSDFEFRLMGDYLRHEFVVQYKETDLAFVSRLAEHVGISMIFEPGEHRDRVVFTDHNNGFDDLTKAPIQFRGRGDNREIFKVECTTQLIPRVHLVHDYNYRIPLIDVAASADAPSGFAGGIVDYGSHAKTPEQAEFFAKVRAEETETTHRVFTLESDLAVIKAGQRILLEGHPKLGAIELVVFEVEHDARPAVANHGEGTRAYKNRFRAIEASLHYRPPVQTPKPKVHGVLNGVIAHEKEGEQSLFGRLDDQGRYLVRFKFDTSELNGRPAVSRRIRMAQPHSGANYGHHTPLKPGIEVLLSFIDGDPDRPVIMSSVPNPITASPVADNCAQAHRIRTATGILIEMKDA